jgi:uncharacterized protein YdeI (YjbR/CyaY-like superfamily)
MDPKGDLPVIRFPSRDAWEAWLADEHASSSGLWLKLAKVGAGVDSVSYADAVEVALCYGWIDGQAARYDGAYWLQRFTPRRRRSNWSKINRARAIELIERGEMKPSGLAEVERAKADGRWNAAMRDGRHAMAPPRATLEDHLARTPAAPVLPERIALGA